MRLLAFECAEILQQQKLLVWHTSLAGFATEFRLANLHGVQPVEHSGPLLLGVGDPVEKANKWKRDGLVSLELWGDTENKNEWRDEKEREERSVTVWRWKPFIVRC